ncbi:MAG: hypothetical protein HGB21_05330, partial [Nitrospirae bacterium]|nr:hypothetical protein [Nitrospirota bacterium]
MFILKLILRNALRHKLRSSLTVVGVAIAVLAFGLLRTLVAAWYLGVESSSASRLVTRNAISLVFSLPLSYREKIRQVPGVKGVSYANWFGGVYITEKNFFPNFAVDAKTYLDLYPEFVLSPEQKKAFILDRKGCVVGRNIAERFGWKVGDAVVLKGTISPGDWEFVVRGIYQGAEKSTDETVRNLSRLIQANTTNPPGNELPAILVVKEILDRDGFTENDYTIVESAPGRVNLVARLRGDGSQRPLLMSGHVDVVPVEREKPGERSAPRPVIDWDQAQVLYEQDKTILLLVNGFNRGGLLVGGEGLQGFVPVSHLLKINCQTEEEERNPILTSYVGKQIA